MLRVQRIYGYQPRSGETGVFLDRLYPRGVHKELMAQLIWLKDLTPSAELRRWYHQDSAHRFAAFAERYRAELKGAAQQDALATLRRILAQQPDTVLLTAVKQPQQSHIAVLIGEMGEKASYDGD